MSKDEGIVFNIQRFTIHDGPGIRTEVFLKGCPLHCVWCGNPESQKMQPELGIYRKNCMGPKQCGHCLEACRQSAVIMKDGFILGVDPERCRACMACAKQCPSNALRIWGKRLTIEEVMDEILRDVQLYRRQKDGGVTVSGGEPMAQWEFTQEILGRCKKLHIHTIMETTLEAPPSHLEAVLPNCSMIITDIKHMDRDKHFEYTGVYPDRILENMIWLSRQHVPYILRMPLVPGYNSSPENLAATRDFIVNELANTPLQFQILRFRRLGEDKYESLGRPYLMDALNPPREQMEQLVLETVDFFKEAGIMAVAGASQKIPGC